ncbi:SGNH/GDSL hydrolase family protein [Gloeobacter violaceus]|nr:SGNH/GDSL hydrolase family protein [Gloeobacter violaceus]
MDTLHTRRASGPPVWSSLFALAFVVAASGLGTPAALAQALSPANAQRLYVFGDSLVDLGNVFIISRGTFPPSPPYFEGRLSNGPLWIEDLAARLNLPLQPSLEGGTGYAFGGATTGFKPSQPPPPGIPPGIPGVLAQVATFAETRPPVAPEDLFFVVAGSNDILLFGESDIDLLLDNVATALSELYAQGARTIVVTNLPPLSRTPLAGSDPQQVAALGVLTRTYNRKLERRLQLLEQTQPGLKPILLDAYALVLALIDNPARFGLTNVTEPCLTETAVCPDPEQYLFWDEVHPTAAVGRILADYAYAVLARSTLPAAR